ncbi:T6SS effector amidase Tae4 family protein [Pokkaliibacter sp. MBI-7]|uniref:T6SS effector amidase Tae4 family protein n=1 Tax=Pokkaliibacter sp. MBI-7 TaxID=3040600 RepID=UPI0024490DDB|nr:T6SS effector amidase Tae4 family protein [Pokkaliibacter sp. MBI-7]MDH2433198.1 T6SS effector amidase Tae4 family protein [Pokkaliibacter sp. MBI-7]
MSKRPPFTQAWAASRRIYDPVDPLGKVASVIGGKVAFNISQVAEPQRWKNTCAVRMSYILNETGTLVPRSGTHTVSGKNGRWYFYRVGNVIDFLQKQWGQPDLSVDDPQIGDSLMEGKKGRDAV